VELHGFSSLRCGFIGLVCSIIELGILISRTPV
jgi:hypothetical protein